MAELVIAAVGADRPGLVDEVTGYLHEAGANVADSRMVNLRGRFALVVLIEAADDRIDAIARGAIAAGEKAGMTVTVSPHKPAGSARKGQPYHVKVCAMDQPGIVHRVTHLLHQHGVNIEELSTTLEPGSYSGTPLFTMELAMVVPAGVPVKKLRAELEALCDSLNCDIEIRSGASL